jgi:hypothetical protein
MMAQQGGRTSKPSQSSKPRKTTGRTQRGSLGSRGPEGQQYQQKDMGAHPAYGKHVRDPDGKEEDYGTLGLHRRGGTTKVERRVKGHDIGHAEDKDARDQENSSEVRRAARQGHKVVRSQNTQERDAAKRRDPTQRGRQSAHGFREVKSDTDIGEDDESDLSSGATGRRKRGPSISR